MASYKYPYIPPEYYPAVMFACKMIRKTGYFNKACSIAANYYNVDADEVAKHVRARQGAGQKGKTGRKYHWYIVLRLVNSCDGSEQTVQDIQIVKATSANNASNRFSYEDYRNSDFSGSYYDLVYFSATYKNMEFSTEDEAKDYATEHYEEIKQENEW